MVDKEYHPQRRSTEFCDKEYHLYGRSIAICDKEYYLQRGRMESFVTKEEYRYL